MITFPLALRAVALLLLALLGYVLLRVHALSAPLHRGSRES